MNEQTPPPPLPLADAQDRLLASAAPLDTVTLPAEAALGHWLAAPLRARRTQPSADLSAMDGYAMQSGQAGPWQVIGESAAGHPFPGRIGQGEAIRISTGAMMPAGADAVLLQENTYREGEVIRLNGEGDPTGRHIRRRGFDFTENEEVIAAGTRIGPPQLALAISSGHAELEICRRPNLAIIDSGDELAADPRICEEHQIPASNGAMLAGMAAGLAGTTRRIGPVPDNLDALAAALADAGDADVIVTSGGASVGDHDLVRPALEAWGAQIGFWRVAMKPGKPLLVARKGDQFVLGLPGNPVSSYVTAFLFLLPLLRKLGGSTQPLPEALSLPLGADVPAGGSRLEFLRAKVEHGMVIPLNQQDSSALRSLASANALVERTPRAEAVSSGTLVKTYLL